MCLTVLEVCFLVAGLWLLFWGKVPANLFQILFGKGEYVLSPLNARLFGAMLASTMPVVFAGVLVLNVLLPEQAVMVSIGFEIGYDLLIGILAIIIARRSRKPVATVQPVKGEPV